MRMLIAAALLVLSTLLVRADECTSLAWIPQTEKCLHWGEKTRLDIMSKSIDAALTRARRPSFYQLVVIRSGRNGATSDSFVGVKTPEGMPREWFHTFYVYVTLDYLAEHDGYPSLTRAGTQRFCETRYIYYPEPDTPGWRLSRREELEKCVYDNMRDNEQYYFTALQREIDRGDEYLAQFKDMSYTLRRDTIRARFGPIREVLSPQ